MSELGAVSRADDKTPAGLPHPMWAQISELYMHLAEKRAAAGAKPASLTVLAEKGAAVKAGEAASWLGINDADEVRPLLDLLVKVGLVHNGRPGNSSPVWVAVSSTNAKKIAEVLAGGTTSPEYTDTSTLKTILGPMALEKKHYANDNRNPEVGKTRADPKSYQILFKGEFDDKRRLENIKQDLSTLFKRDIETINRLFAGKAVVIQRDLEYDAAIAYKRAFESTGAKCKIMPAIKSSTRIGRQPLSRRKNKEKPEITSADALKTEKVSSDKQGNWHMGEKVPQTGTYKCVYCGPEGMAARALKHLAKNMGFSYIPPESARKEPSKKVFKKGEVFTSCPNCENTATGDTTGWEFVSDKNEGN